MFEVGIVLEGGGEVTTGLFPMCVQDDIVITAPWRCAEARQLQISREDIQRAQ